MRKNIFTLVAFTALTLVGCKSEADDGVGEKPRSSTETNFFFRNGATHTIHMQEKEKRTVTIDGATDNFTYETPVGYLSVSKSTDPSPSLVIEAEDGSTGSHDIRISDKTANGVGITATLTVIVGERDRGWDGNNFVIENIDGDKTTKDAKDYVDIEVPEGFTYDDSTLKPDGAGERVIVKQTGNLLKVTAKNHYDETTPITLRLKKTDAEDRVVTIKRVTKFWRTDDNGTRLAGLSSDTYVTKRSFDMLQNPPKVPYTVKRVYPGSSTSTGGGYLLYGNAKITKIDLNNVEIVDEYAFCISQNLETVVANKVKYIYKGAFWGTKISRINLPEVETIQYNVFSGTPLQSAVIGSKLKSLQHSIFPDGTREVRINVTTPNQISMTFQSTPSWYSPTGYNNNTTLYVPTAYVNDWKLKFPWIEQAFKGGIKGM
nr:leucine-rich repeat domain-containing protein [uncultured Capnocytophaga sp.]